MLIVYATRSKHGRNKVEILLVQKLVTAIVVKKMYVLFIASKLHVQNISPQPSVSGMSL
jgi:hypothetical protein